MIKNKKFSSLKRFALAGLVGACSMSGIKGAVIVPEVLYYSFNEGGGGVTANLAAPGQGSNPATVNGLTLDIAGADGTALRGNGVSSSSNFVDTGWTTSLAGDWTIAFWYSPVLGSSSSLGYVAGDDTASSFRIFNGGAAGSTGMIMRGGLSDVLITGLSSVSNNHIAYVYDSGGGEVRGYLNGVLNTTVSQGVLTYSGSSSYKVGGYSSSSAVESGEWLDEFRLYSRALSVGEVGIVMSDFTVVPEPSGALLAFGGLGLVAFRRKRT